MWRFWQSTAIVIILFWFAWVLHNRITTTSPSPHEHSPHAHSPHTSSWESPTDTKVCYHVQGWKGCGYLAQAIQLGEAEKERNPSGVDVLITEWPRDQWYGHLATKTKELGVEHKTSPLVFEGCTKEEERYIGGFTEFRRKLMEQRQREQQNK